MNKFKQYITSLVLQAFVVVNIIGLPPVVVNSNVRGYVLHSADFGAGNVILRIRGEKIPPERIENLIAQPRLVSGVYPGDELGGRVELTWVAPKDPEVYDIHPDTYVFSYIIKYDTSTRGYNLDYIDQLWQWWDNAQKVFSNHIWELPTQAQGQTFEVYPLGFGIPAPEERYRLTFGITDKIIITGLPKAEKIWIGVSSRDRYYNQSTPTVVETYVPASVEPPSKITNLTVSYGGPATLQLTWTSPANDRFSIDASSGLYNIPYGRYCLAYSTHLPLAAEFYPKDIPVKWPDAQVIYIDTSTVRFVPQVYNVTGLSLIDVSTTVGYYFLVWTSDEWFGKNNWSKPSNLATWGLVAPNYVTDIVVVSSASAEPSKGSYAIISWTNPPEDIPLEGVKIYYSTSNYTTDEAYFVCETTTPAQRVTTYHYELLPRHWYYYVLMSYNLAGSRPWSLNVIAKTYTAYDIIPPEPVSRLTASVSASEQDGVYISLNWTLPDASKYENKDFYIDGRIEVYYSTTSFTDPNQTLLLYPNTATSATLTGLMAYTTYYISVVTVDGGNNRSTPTVISVYTPVDPYAPMPPFVSKDHIYVGASPDENIGSSVTFRIVNPPDLDLKEVWVYYSTIGYTGERISVRTNNTTPGATYYFSIKQLIPRVTYYFEFVAYDMTGKSSVSRGRMLRDVYIDKDVLSPEVPSNVRLIPDTKPESKPYGSYVRIEFNLPDMNKYRNFDLAGYEIYASSYISPPYSDPNAVRVVSDRRDVISYELLNLEQHVTYYVTIHSFDPVGNKSTSTVFEVFTWKDLVPPRPAEIRVSTPTISLDPAEGVKVEITVRTGSDRDVSRSVLELSTYEDFCVICSSVEFVGLTPSAVRTRSFAQLDVGVQYYAKAKLYDWSGNVSVSTVTFVVPTPPTDGTVPLAVVGIKLKVRENKLVLQWNKVRHHYNVATDKIESFGGINNAGPDRPTTFELYKYKIFYKQNIFNDEEQWYELTWVSARGNTCELPYKNGYYKIVSYDICGNSSDSIVIDDASNCYFLKDGVYVKFVADNVEEVSLFYYDAETYLEQQRGVILRSFAVKPGNLDETQGKINYVDMYRFKNENYVGVKYSVINGKVKFVGINKSLEVNPEMIDRQVAFYVFDGKEYIRATTYVDKINKVVYFKTKYLTKVQLRRVDTTGEFNFVEAKPQVITPDSSPGENDIVFFIFNNPRGSEVKIRIYDINSVLVWEKVTKDDSSTVGSYIGWDGKDFDGKYVLPGVYVYQIEAEGKKYKGIVTVAR